MSGIKVFSLFCIIGFILIFYENNKNTAPLLAPTTGKTSEFEDAVPSAESDFVNTITRFAAAYRAVGSDLSKGAQRPARASALCTQFSGDIRNWIGTLTTLSSNNEGKGVIEITIGPNITLGTWNNSLSDIMDHTLIDPSSRVYARAVALQTGIPVRFSGTLIKGGVDCFREESLTQAGAMTRPTWLMRFTDIGGTDERN